MKHLSENMQGALLMMAAMAGFTVNDMFMKLAFQDLQFFQAIFLRGCLISILMTLMAIRLGVLRPDIPAGDKPLIVVRVVMEVCATLAFLTALQALPLANVTALLQVLPLAVTLAGALFLGEAVGWRRWTAIIIAFAGVLLIVRPGVEGFNSDSLYGVVAVICIVIRDIATRRLSPATPSVFVAFMTALVITATGGALSLSQGWGAPTTDGAIALVGAALFLIIGYIAATATMRVGEIAIVAPFRYTSLVWALVLGFLVLGERPDSLTLLGAAIIVVMGLFSFYRERQLTKAGV